MFFKDIKPDSNIFVYNRQDNTLKTGRVVSVSPPHLDTNFANRQASYDASMAMYVDVVLDINGNITPPYVCPEKSEIVYANNIVLCPDITPIIREVEATKNAAEQQLSQREVLEERVKKCNDILSEYNPQFRKEKEYDERFNKIEGSMDKMTKMFEQFMNEWNGNKTNKN